MDGLTIAIAGGAWDARIAPADGGGLIALRHGGQDVLVAAPAGARLGGPFGAFWMIPWANRLDAGRLGPHRLPVNRPQDGTAIHGLSRDQPWRVAQRLEDRVILVQDIDVAPYSYAAGLVIAAGAGDFTLDLAVTNAGDVPLPFGAGWHPWFVRPPGTRIAFRATHRCTHDSRCLPVAAAPSPGLDGGEEALLGLDTHFAGWDGVARIAWPGRTLTMTATGALATNLQVYAPRDRPVLCVEPSSHLPDAVNRPELAPLGPMQALAPGETLTGRIRLDCSHGAGAGA
ncbi:aldose epimerase [Roseomonas eburnea]|uniref:Aldose epimerase n=1 Tax=Neoroseomonas eburnea TaxID=1346889 RepID=A0A9X9XDW1_9PROT|nr:aldose epimerase [Neoroseomonas eburnea]MBR0681897.1 aldose epimerase [Neoroseomonas eburnea]